MSRLTTARRKKLPRSDFGEPRKRKYPDDTLARSRSALARGKHYLSKRAYLNLAKRIHRKHPSMKIKVLDTRKK